MMKLKELRNLDKDDVLEMMGLQSRTSTGAWLAGALGTFGVGLVVGAGLGLLLAPKPGRELRDDLRDKFRRIPSDEADSMSAMGRESPGASKPY
jgi:gas vesicle protein